MLGFPNVLKDCFDLFDYKTTLIISHHGNPLILKIMVPDFVGTLIHLITGLP